MSVRGKRRWSVLLALTLLCTMFCGSTASAKDYWKWHEGYSDVRDLEEEHLIDVTCVLNIPEDYTVTINGQRVTGSYVTMVDSIVVSYSKDENNKTIDFVYEPISNFHRIYRAGKGKLVKPGTRVTLTATLPDNLKPAVLGFQSWYVTGERENGWYADPDKAVDVGLSKEELSQTSISFIMPDQDLYIYYEYRINTVSGNSWWFGHWDSDVEGLVPVENIEITVEGSGSSKTASDSNQGGEQAAASAEIPNAVRLADGTVMTSQTQMQYVARSVQGVIPATGKEAVESAAGLTAQETAAGTKAKFYIGDVYKKEVKKQLSDAAVQAGGSLVSMLDMDLYTIGRNGVNAVRQTGEPVRMVIGIPEKYIKEGREFSLVYIDAEGNLVQIPDTDNDQRTITVDLTRFGAFAIIYK